MILTVIEPAYFPPLSYFAKVIASDVIIWADSFQFKKHSIINRTSIKTVSGPTLVDDTHIKQKAWTTNHKRRSNR